MDVRAVDATNAAQLQAWDGDEGAYWAANADRFDRAVAAYHERLMAAAAIAPDERVLDIGCGTGQTTRDAARSATAGSALGIDLSSRMLDVARRRAADEGVENVAFVDGDAQVHAFEPASFDAAISRSGAMFFGDPVAAFANIARALRRGGRIVLVTWQPLSQNEWIREISDALSGGRTLSPPPADAPGPFALSDPARVRALLEAAGFVSVDLAAASAPMWFGSDADDAHSFVLGLMRWMVRDVDHATRARAVDALRATMEAHTTGDGVTFASSWVVTALRTG